MNKIHKTIFAMTLIVAMIALPSTLRTVAADPGGEPGGTCYSWNTAHDNNWDPYYEPAYCQCVHTDIENPDNFEVGIGVQGFYFANDDAFYKGQWDFNSEAGWSLDGNDPCLVYGDAPLVCTFCYDYENNPSNPTYYNYNCYSQDVWSYGYYSFGYWNELIVPGDSYPHYAHIRDYQYQSTGYFYHYSIEGVTQGEYHYWNDPYNHHYKWANTQDPNWDGPYQGPEPYSFAFLTAHYDSYSAWYGGDWL